MVENAAFAAIHGMIVSLGLTKSGDFLPMVFSEDVILRVKLSKLRLNWHQTTMDTLNCDSVHFLDISRLMPRQRIALKSTIPMTYLLKIKSHYCNITYCLCLDILCILKVSRPIVSKFPKMWAGTQFSSTALNFLTKLLATTVLSSGYITPVWTNVHFVPNLFEKNTSY